MYGDGGLGGVIVAGSRGCVSHYLRLTCGKLYGATPGPVMNTIVMCRSAVVKRNCRVHYKRTRTRMGTVHSIGSRGLLGRSAVCMDLRPYSRCKGAPPYTSLVVRGEVPGIMVNYVSPFSRMTNENVRGLHGTNVRMAMNILRRRYQRLVEHFVAFGALGHPCVALG